MRESLAVSVALVMGALIAGSLYKNASTFEVVALALVVSVIIAPMTLGCFPTVKKSGALLILFTSMAVGGTAALFLIYLNRSSAEKVYQKYVENMSEEAKTLPRIFQEKSEGMEVVILSHEEKPVGARYAPNLFWAKTEDSNLQILVHVDSSLGRDCIVGVVIPGNKIMVKKVQIGGQDWYFADSCSLTPVFVGK